MDVKRKNKILGALGLLALFIMYQTSITAFTHVHYINGVLVTHSHPFHGAHSHTKASFVVIEHLSTFSSLEVDCYEDCHPLRALLAVLKVVPETPTVKGEVIRACSLRAPPVVLFS